jgi:hypothetical protein
MCGGKHEEKFAVCCYCGSVSIGLTVRLDDKRSVREINKLIKKKIRKMIKKKRLKLSKRK